MIALPLPDGPLPDAGLSFGGVLPLGTGLPASAVRQFSIAPPSVTPPSAALLSVALLLPVAAVLAVLAGVCALAGYLWYQHAARLHAESFFPDDATGIWLLRHGVAAGFATFGGFLLAFVLFLFASDVGAVDPQRPLVGLPFFPVAVGLFLLSLSLFVVAGVGYAADALRARFGVR